MLWHAQVQTEDTEEFDKGILTGIRVVPKWKGLRILHSRSHRRYDGVFVAGALSTSFFNFTPAIQSQRGEQRYRQRLYPRRYVNARNINSWTGYPPPHIGSRLGSMIGSRVPARGAARIQAHESSALQFDTGEAHNQLEPLPTLQINVLCSAFQFMRFYLLFLFNIRILKYALF